MLTYTMRYCVSDLGLGSLINVIDSHLLQKVYKSKYLFLKSFGAPESVTYFYCANCWEIINFIETEKTTVCLHCRSQYKKRALMESSQFFIYLPLKGQLIEIINSEIYIKFRQESEDESDIINGSCYQDLKRRGIIREQDISIQWNTGNIIHCITLYIV